MITKLTAVACILVATVLTAATSASPVHFAGVPPKGVKPSRPTTGTMVVSLSTIDTTWNVYADGRVIWQKWTRAGDATVVPNGAKRLDTTYVQQRLTLQGVQLLQSKVLATGLFEHDLNLELPASQAYVYDQVRVGDRIVTVSGLGPYWLNDEQRTKATQAQLDALTSLEHLMTDPASWLPSEAWADSEIRAFVPARYLAAFDRNSPDLSRLPPLARKAFRRYYLGHGCLVTTAHTRALLRAFVRAGISLSENHADWIAFDLVGSRKRPRGRRIPAVFHFSPALPDAHC